MFAVYGIDVYPIFISDLGMALHSSEIHIHPGFFPTDHLQSPLLLVPSQSIFMRTLKIYKAEQRTCLGVHV